MSSKSFSIQLLIPEARLRFTDQLDLTKEKVNRWNNKLEQMFKNAEVMEKWNEIFKPSYLLRNEATLYQEILGLD